MIHQLLLLQPDGDEQAKPRALGLAESARNAFQQYYDAHGAEAEEATGPLAAAWSKLEEIPLRLALVFHCVRQAAGDDTVLSENVVDLVSMNTALQLTEWFKRETRRVYSILGESDAEAEQRNLLAWIKRKGGTVTARELQQGQRTITSSQKAERVLTDLVNDGYGSWERSSGSGRPTKRFLLHTASKGLRQSQYIAHPIVPSDGPDRGHLVGPASRSRGQMRPNAARTNRQDENESFRCRSCENSLFRDVSIHDGRSVRRDCAVCGRFVCFAVWYGKDSDRSEKNVAPGKMA